MTYRLVLNEITFPAAPVGKRTIKTNIYGNVVGYVSGRRFWEFGADSITVQREADMWANKGYSLEAIHSGEAYEKEGLFD
jgi:hypothetical protein